MTSRCMSPGAFLIKLDHITDSTTGAEQMRYPFVRARPNPNTVVVHETLAGISGRIHVWVNWALGERIP